MRIYRTAPHPTDHDALPRRRRGRVAVIVLGLALVLAACGDARVDGGDGDNGDDGSSDGGGPVLPEIEGEPMDTEVDDGNITFVAHEIECGLESIGEDDTPDGQYCVLEITVTNNGDEDFELSASNQRMITSDGETTRAEGSPRIRRALESPVFDALPPGESATGAIAFDIPAETEADQVRLRESNFTAGALVALR